MARTGRLAFLIGFAALAVAGVMLLVPPIAQDPAYHRYADHRVLWGIAHAGDVLSNAAFSIVGVWGLWRLYATPMTRSSTACGVAARSWTSPLATFLLGVTLVGPASAFYHQTPGNESLAWDRFPMTVAFMGLLTALVSDRIGERIARALLVPLVVIGLASVVYWRVTDDLRPYALVQFLPMVVALLMCAMFPARGGLHGPYLAWLLVFYGLAKIAEAGDAVIWQWTDETVSGHTLKHILAAVACGSVAVFVGRQERHAPERHVSKNHSMEDVR